MTIRELLIAARALCAHAWCQGAPARNAAGEPVQVRATDACCWCPLGALRCFNAGFDVHDEARQALYLALPPNWRRRNAMIMGRDQVIAAYNDAGTRRQEQMLALFDRALAGLREEGE